MRRALSFPAQGWAGNLSVESSRPSKGTVGLMCRPVRDEFRVPATERFGNVAVPANGPVGGQGLLKMFQRNLIPLEAVALLEWNEIPLEHLQQTLSTHWPVCWNCHIAETFRRRHPELVTDRPAH